MADWFINLSNSVVAVLKQPKPFVGHRRSETHMLTTNNVDAREKLMLKRQCSGNLVGAVQLIETPKVAKPFWAMRHGPIFLGGALSTRAGHCLGHLAPRELVLALTLQVILGAMCKKTPAPAPTQ